MHHYLHYTEKALIESIRHFFAIREGRELPLDHVGCFSFTFDSWMTSTMVKANKVGLTKADVFTLADSDKAKTNAERLQRIWEELPEDSRTMSRAVWIFARTRIVVALLLMMLSLILQFLGPVSNHTNMH